MAENYLYAQRKPDAFQSFLQGFTGGQQIIGNISQQQMAGMKNQMLQREMQKEEAVKNALANYGQPGFGEEQAVKAIIPHAPELALKIKDTMRKSTKDQIDMMGAAAKMMEQIGPSLIDNPQGFHSAWQRMETIMPGIMPSLANFIDPNTQQLDIPRMNEAVKRMTTGGAMFLEEVKLKNRDPKYHYVPAQDSEGNMIVNRIDEITGQVDQPQGIKGQKTPGMQMETQLPDGTILRMGSGGSKGMSPTGLQPGVQKEVEEKLLGATDNLRLVTDLRGSMEQEFQTYPGQAKQWLLTTGEKMGMSPGKDNQKYVERFSTFYAKAKNLHSTILKNLSGLAVTATEEQRIKAFTIDPDKDSFTQSKSKLQNLEDDLQSVIARTNYIRKHGMSIKNAPEDIKAIMVQKGKQFKDEAIRKGIPPEAIDNVVKEQINDYFLRPSARLGLVE